MNHNIFTSKFLPLGKNMTFIDCNKSNLSLKAWILQNLPKLGSSRLLRTKKNMCIYSSLNVAKQYRVLKLCICCNQAWLCSGISTNGFQLLLTKLTQWDKLDCDPTSQD